VLNLSHKNLNVWKLSVDLITDVYKITAEFPKEELYVLTSQLRRAAISVASNIAEGAARQSKPEKKRFFQIARSSLVEVDTQFEIARKLNYFQDDKFLEIDETINHIFASLSNLIHKTRN